MDAGAAAKSHGGGVAVGRGAGRPAQLTRARGRGARWRSREARGKSNQSELEDERGMCALCVVICMASSAFIVFIHKLAINM